MKICLFHEAGHFPSLNYVTGPLKTDPATVCHFVIAQRKDIDCWLTRTCCWIVGSLWKKLLCHTWLWDKTFQTKKAVGVSSSAGPLYLKEQLHHSTQSSAVPLSPTILSLTKWKPQSTSKHSTHFGYLILFLFSPPALIGFFSLFFSGKFSLCKQWHLSKSHSVTKTGRI